MDSLARVTALLTRHPLIDGHNDLAWAIREAGDDLDALGLDRGGAPTHTDWPRATSGQLGAQFWSVYAPGDLPHPEAVVATLEQIDRVKRLVGRYPARLGLATSASEVEAVFASGRIASLLGAEGGQSIASSLGVLRCLYELGVRYLTLTHNHNVGWADAATDVPDCGGLTDFGRDVVAEMNRLGMLVDCSHVAASTMNAVLDVARAPIIFSHSGARALCSAPGNVPDDVLARLATNGGVCMAVFAPGFVSQEVWDYVLQAQEAAVAAGLDPRAPEGWSFLDAYRRQHPAPRATLAQVADHVDHLRAVAGVEHVGIGADFDGVPTLPEGLDDVSRYPALFAELADRGWSDADLVALAGGNLLRALRDAEDVARASSDDVRR